MPESDTQGAVSRRLHAILLKSAGAATVCTALGLGFLSLATVGTDRWIETSYDRPWPAVPTPDAAGVAELPPSLVVGDEQQWLSAPRFATQKVVAAPPGTGGLALGDRLVLSVGAKRGGSPLARTFEVVGIEVLAAPEGGTAAGRLPHVLIAREVDPSGKPMTLRLIVSEGDEPLPPPQKTL